MLEVVALWGFSMVLHTGSELVKGQPRDANLDLYPTRHQGNVSAPQASAHISGWGKVTSYGLTSGAPSVGQTGWTTGVDDAFGYHDDCPSNSADHRFEIDVDETGMEESRGAPQPCITSKFPAAVV